MGEAHLKKDNASKAGVCFEDWFGNNEADAQAKSGAAKHGYTENQKNEHTLVREDAANNQHIKGTPT
eukprot:10191553-Heterocapsa_arctica.AAC.1